MTKTYLLCLIAIILSACGGGGDECQPIAKETSQNLQLIGDLGKEIVCVP